MSPTTDPELSEIAQAILRFSNFANGPAGARKFHNGRVTNVRRFLALEQDGQWSFGPLDIINGSERVSEAWSLYRFELSANARRRIKKLRSVEKATEPDEFARIHEQFLEYCNAHNVKPSKHALSHQYWLVASNSLISQPNESAPPALPDSIAASHVLVAIGDIDRGVEHGFADSTDYDVLHNRRRYPPKAVVALAARHVTGLTYRPSDFRGGEGTKCFQLLRDAGFIIVPKVAAPNYPEDLGDREYSEGLRKTVTVNAYERDSQARADCIARYGYACTVCEFDFGAVYGPLGEGFIHVHHLVPLHKIGQQYKVNPEKDLRPVCPNCHAMLHRGLEPLTIAQLRAVLGKPALPGDGE